MAGFFISFVLSSIAFAHTYGHLHGIPLPPWYLFHQTGTGRILQQYSTDVPWLNYNAESKRPGVVFPPAPLLPTGCKAAEQTHLHLYDTRFPNHAAYPVKLVQHREDVYKRQYIYSTAIKSVLNA